MITLFSFLFYIIEIVTLSCKMIVQISYERKENMGYDQVASRMQAMMKNRSITWSDLVDRPEALTIALKLAIQEYGELAESLVVTDMAQLVLPADEPDAALTNEELLRLGHVATNARRWADDSGRLLQIESVVKKKGKWKRLELVLSDTSAEGLLNSLAPNTFEGSGAFRLCVTVGEKPPVKSTVFKDCQSLSMALRELVSMIASGE